MSNFKSEYEKRLAMVEKAIADGTLPTTDDGNISPPDFIKWAHSVGISVPDELRAGVKKYHGDGKNKEKTNE